MTPQEAIIKEFENLGDYHEVNGEDVYDPPTLDEMRKFLLTSMCSEYRRGCAEAVEYIEKNSDPQMGIALHILEEALSLGEKSL